MKNLKIDEDAHRILVAARDKLEKRGIENPNLSDAIRELDRQVKGSELSACPKLPSP